MSERIHFPIFTQPSPDSATLFQATGTALTGSYALVGVEMQVDGATEANLHLYWTKGDETSVEVKVEFALRSGGTQAQETISTGTSAAGQETVKTRDYSFNTAADNIIIPVDVRGRFLNVYIKATGGTPTGTFGMGLHLMRR